jgi:DNA-entry nuclease
MGIMKKSSLILLTSLILAGCGSQDTSTTAIEPYTESTEVVSQLPVESVSEVSVPVEPQTNTETVQNSIPSYTGSQVITLNNNLVTFSDLGTSAYLNLGSLDSYGRATKAVAVLDAEHQRSSEGRTSIDAYVPGYQSVKVTYNGKQNWAYNRSHLVAYTLWDADFTINGQDVGTDVGEIDRTENLVAGTRQLNVGDTGMTNYEELIRDALERGEVVQYVVTPYYEGSELVPRGVQLEAKSNGSLEFNVFIFNVGDGFDINYQTGEVVLTGGQVVEAQPVQEVAPQQEVAVAPSTDNVGQTVYITKTGSKYHLDPNCRGLANANSVIQSTLSEAESKGLEKCAFED